MKDNWDGRLKHGLSRMEGDTGRQGWLTKLCKGVLPLRRREAQRGFPLNRFLCFSGVSGGRGSRGVC